MEKLYDDLIKQLIEIGRSEIIPSIGYYRVLANSVYQAHCAQRNSVNAMNVLVSIFSYKESHAVSMLKLNNISRLDVMEGISSQLADT